ncbi:protein of unknown function [Bacteroides faecichinchillae]|uniref:DUF3868 domain-containing protein n=1 Tax=Bacteroides faecichinchillae TaxID=871325 RepID=A0A1M4T4S7_9BACE|nr:DUF3868 domain-containing protein [Bacteroides faecichinchillae]THG58405.1 DUF3868 domain-containing protein [Bacteroides faecichinchillae]SHE39512.1 protein of unknown function [Bacteroides faecichinchillae]
MKRTIFILVALLGLGSMSGVAAQKVKDIIPGVSINHFKMERNGKYLTVEMSVNLTALNVEANRAVLLTPRLVNGTDSLDLPSIGIYGRKRYYYYVRNGIGSISGTNEAIWQASKIPNNIDYHNSIIYKEWMDGATLKFHRSDWGCCHEILAEYENLLGQHNETFFPELVFVRPEAELMKSRSLSGSAFIDFPVNKTVIYPEYRRNTVELGKIEATIDSVRNDKDVSIISVWLKGYASPESPYTHNRDLAIGRTESLKEHIRRLYNFADDIIVTEHEPEDWEGLRRYVESSNINHRAEILEMIDSDLEPDAKEAKIKRTYPEEYRFLLQHCYPALRHTDYRIDYNIRSYNDVEEIKRVLKERPQNLSLNEFYLVASTHEPGTTEFTDVFETAVRMFPNDKIANLNAANAAIRQDDHKAARRYLDKAGDSAEAAYARGALAIREKDYKTAAMYLGKARKMGLEKAVTTLAELTERGYTE